MEINVTLGSWMPDMPALNNPGVTTAFNVTPTFGSMQGAVTYQPLKAASLYSAATMESRPLGTAIGLDKLGNAKVYAGSANKLYRNEPATRDWQNMSRDAGYSTADGENWRSTEYGNGIYFTNFSNEMQYINKDADTAPNAKFANVTTLVKSRYMATVKDYIVVGNTYDALDGAVPFRVRWSGLGLPLAWDFSQATGADFQDVYGYGPVQGIVGGEAGWLLMKDGIVKMSFTGAPLWFQFDPVPKAKGCAVPQSIITVEGYTYFIANDGFYRMDGNTGQTQPIGAGKIDQTFLNSVNTANYSYMTVATDPREKLIYWSYMSLNAVNGTPDRMLIYNYASGDWTLADATADFIFNSLSLPWTIEQLDVFGAIENIPASFDSPLWAGGNAMLWAMRLDGSIYVYGGETLPAIIETAEQLLSRTLKQMDPKTTGDRSNIDGVRPLYDGHGEATVQVGSRSQSNAVVVWSNPRTLHAHTGWAYFRKQDRYHRFRIRMTGEWSNVSELQIDASGAGSR